MIVGCMWQILGKGSFFAAAPPPHPHLQAAPKKPILNRVKEETLEQVFSCEFCEIFKNTFFYRTPSWLLLEFQIVSWYSFI